MGRSRVLKVELGGYGQTLKLGASNPAVLPAALAESPLGPCLERSAFLKDPGWLS